MSFIFGAWKAFEKGLSNLICLALSTAFSSLRCLPSICFSASSFFFLSIACFFSWTSSWQSRKTSFSKINSSPCKWVPESSYGNSQNSISSFKIWNLKSPALTFDILFANHIKSYLVQRCSDVIPSSAYWLCLCFSFCFASHKLLPCLWLPLCQCGTDQAAFPYNYVRAYLILHFIQLNWSLCASQSKISLFFTINAFLVLSSSTKSLMHYLASL